MNWVELLVVALPPTIAGISAWYQARATHLAVNSRMDELLKLARTEAGATATLVEKAAEGERQAVGAAAVLASKVTAMG